MRHKLFICLLALLLILGFANYILFQPGILLLRYFSVATEPRWPAPVFFTSYFSDIAWCAALCLAVAMLAGLKLLARKDKLFILSLPFVTEAAQGFHFINGTFDWYDMLLYGLIILVFSLAFPSLNIYKMKKAKLQVWPLLLFTGFLLMAIASTAPKYTYKAPKPEPCITHLGLSYSPVLVKINLSGSYTMKDLPGAQRFGYEYIMDALKTKYPGKYQLADGVTPNLTLDIVINTDSYQHYGATLNGYVYDGSFYNSWSNDYVTPEKLFDDIASKVDVYIRYGWCKNCPSPCVPK